MPQRLCRRNLLLIRCYGFLIGFWVHLPISYLYYFDHGLSFARIGLVFAAASLVSILCEIPSGAFADLVGRKYSMIVASACLACSFIILGSSATFAQFVGGAVLRGIADAFLSGADTALVYDSLKAASREDEFGRHIGARWQYWSFGFGCSALLASVIIPFGAHYTFYVSAGAAGLSLLAATVLIEPPHAPSRVSYGRHIREALRFARGHREVRRLVLYQCTLVGSILVFFQYIQFYLQQAGLPRSAYGVIYTYFTFLCGISAGQAHRLRAEQTQGAVMLSFPLIFAAAIACLAFGGKSAAAVLAAVSAMEVLFGAAPTLINHYYHRHVESFQRATVDSVKNFATNLAFALLAPLVGLIADRFDFTTALILLAAAAAAAGLALWRPEGSHSL